MTVSGKGDNLRPEACPLDFSELNESQRRAFMEIVDKISGALNILDKKGCDYDSSRSKKDIQYGIPLYESNWNPTVFLSGERGSGKTSLLFSLIKAYSDFCNLKDFHYTAPKNPPDSGADLEDIFGKLKNRIVWLETLDMESLPGPVNLLAAIHIPIENSQRTRDGGLSKQRHPDHRGP